MAFTKKKLGFGLGVRACTKSNNPRRKALRMKETIKNLREKTKQKKEFLRKLNVLRNSLWPFNSINVNISSIEAKKISDSRGNPTIEVELCLFGGTLVTSSLPACRPYGVLKAVDYVNEIIGPALIWEVTIDNLLVKKLDTTLDDWGWSNRELGANAVLAVSTAVCKAGAHVKGIPLYRHISNLAGENDLVLPVPAFNSIRHAMLELTIIPLGASSLYEADDMGGTVYRCLLKTLFKQEYGIDEINDRDEGSVSPNIQGIEEGMKLLQKAIAESGYIDKVFIGVDVAASDCYDMLDKTYQLSFHEENNDGSAKKISIDALEDVYKSLVSEYPIVSIEHPFHQHHLSHSANLTHGVGCKVQVVGDDHLVMNQKMLGKEIKRRSCNALHLKVNQIGSSTLTECIEAVKIAKEAGWDIIMSTHGSGETEDYFIADLSVGLAVDQIKIGVSCNQGRVNMYNRLYKIDYELRPNSVYAGGRLYARRAVESPQYSKYAF